jgi:hypothetical protein
MRHNLNPEVWGPHAWFFIESSVLSYPDNPTDSDKKKMSTFLKSIQYAIPCEGCRHHYKSNLKSNPLTDNVLKNKDELFKWVVEMHNSANRRNTFAKSENETLQYYISVYNSEPKYKYINENFHNDYIYSSDNIKKKNEIDINNSNDIKENFDVDQKTIVNKSYFACFLLLLIAIIFIYIYKKI